MAKQITGKKPKNMKKAIRTFLRCLSNHKPAPLLVGVLVTASAGANLYGTHPLNLLINNYILPRDYDGFVWVVLFMGLIYAGGALYIAVYKQLMTYTAQSIVKKTREGLFSRTQKLPLRFFDTNTYGGVMSHFTDDLDTVQDTLSNCLDNLIQSFVMVTEALLAILLLNQKLPPIVMFFMIIVHLMTQYFSRKSKYYLSHQQAAMRRLNSFIEEVVDGIKVVKVFSHEQKNYEESERCSERLRRASTEALIYSSRVIPTIASTSYSNYATVICIGGLFAIGEEIGLGAFVSYLVYVCQTALPVSQLTQQLNFILAVMVGAERILEVMEECEEVGEGRVTLTRVRKLEANRLQECREYTGHWVWRHPHEDSSVELVELRGDVRFHDVVFGYEPEVMIPEGTNPYAKLGQRITFVGSTGAGKTTTTNLTNRFYGIESGSVTYDGIDVELIHKDNLRHSTSIILQDTHLFTGAVVDNIRCGNLHVDVNGVINTARFTNAHSFIERPPNGYDTMLNGGGANLSQGQRQLLVIVGTAIANPPVLILDEAASSIDTRTGKLIEKGMDRLMEN